MSDAPFGSQPPATPPQVTPSAPPPPRPASSSVDAAVWVQLTLFTVVASLVLFVARVGRTQARWSEMLGAEVAVETRVALDEIRGAIAQVHLERGVWPGLALRVDRSTAGVAPSIETELERVVDCIENRLGHALPANPWNGSPTLRVLAPDAPWPARFDGGTGWIYRPSTGEIRANVPDEIAASGVRLSDL